MCFKNTNKTLLLLLTKPDLLSTEIVQKQNNTKQKSGVYFLIFLKQKISYLKNLESSVLPTSCYVRFLAFIFPLHECP